MRPRFFVLALAFALAAQASAQRSSPAGRVSLGGHRTLGTPRTFRNLSLIPVYDAAARPNNAYMTLDEGLKTGQVQVRERGSGDVNTLLVSNNGRKPLYVMAGEVVLGGQQDRCLARDTILPPGKRDVPVTVFCVEHGRWQGQAAFDQSAPTLAAADIRASAQEGAFTPPPTASPQAAAGRATTEYGNVERAQSTVWAKVAKKNERFEAAPAGGSYRGVLTATGGEAGRSVAPYLKALSGSLKSDPHLVGVVAAVNGKPVAADIFGDPVLFRKLWPKLLRSYATDAAESAGRPAAKSVTPRQARTFLLGALSAGSKAENRSADAHIVRRESKDALAYRLIPNQKSPTPAINAPALHENVLAH
jgi:hypothetical protein